MPETDRLVFYAVWIGGAALAAWIGRRQGRNALTCFVAGIVVTPLLAVPVLLWLGRPAPKAGAGDGGSDPQGGGPQGGG